jgi:hypothetical protein
VIPPDVARAAHCRNSNQQILVHSGPLSCRARAKWRNLSGLRTTYSARMYDVTLNLERRSLHWPFACVHDETGQTINGRKAQREVIAPPRTWAFARGVNQELRRVIDTRRSCSAPHALCHRRPS